MWYGTVMMKKLLKTGKTLIMPDAYDPISARLIEKSGFEAVQCSGYSFSVAAAKGKETDISRAENVAITKKIVEAVNIPVMADAEDGYGNSDTVQETVSMFIEAGVSGLNIEDQILEGNGVRIISGNDMVEKIQMAKKTSEQLTDNFIINGRTDALRSTEDREEALNLSVERANLYLDAGADIAFPTYVETIEEVEVLKNEVKGPISIAAGMPYNILNFTLEDLKDLKVDRISLPSLMIYSGLKALQQSLNYLKDDDLKTMVKNGMLYSVNELDKLI